MIVQSVKNESAPPSFLDFPNGKRLAYFLTEGSLPGIVFMGGFRSDMTGTKAMALETYCRNQGRRFLRFDYSAHGRSTGKFKQCTISHWFRDACDMLDYVALDKNILVGSSMGAWIMMLAAQARPKQVAGLVSIAAAPDFTEKLIWQKLSEEEKKKLEEDGVIYVPECGGGEPYPISRLLIEDGRRHLLLDKKITIDAPMRMIHGSKDQDVPWYMSAKLMECIKSPDISFELIKDGDHRLSYPGQLAFIWRTIEEVLLLAK